MLSNVRIACHDWFQSASSINGNPDYRILAMISPPTRLPETMCTAPLEKKRIHHPFQRLYWMVATIRSSVDSVFRRA